MRRWIIVVGLTGIGCLIGCLIGCGQTDRPSSSPAARTPSSAVADPTRLHQLGRDLRAAELSVLFIGNSHTYYHDMPEMFAQLARKFHSGEVLVRTCVDTFLARHAANPHTRGRLAAGPWSCVILQAQKYSTSGQYTYPHDAAVELTAAAVEQGATVVMFPEWPRRGHRDEADRIMRLHEKIAGETGAIVAPVGPAWVACLAERPDLDLYDPDGNHCSPKGAFLTACVVLATATGHDPRNVTLDDDRIPRDQQKRLARIAWETCRKYSAASVKLRRTAAGI